jgi:hypothetical protein
MSEPDTTRILDEHPAVRDHGLVCLGSLTLLIGALVLRRPDPWVLLPAFLGALGLLFRWRAAPVLLLLAVMLLLGSWWLGTDLGRLGTYATTWLRLWLTGWWPGRLPLSRSGPGWRGPLLVSDLLLAVSLLAYAAGHYRLQGLLVRLFPPDPRQARVARRGPEEASRRSPDLVSARELVVVLVVLTSCAGLASLLWARLKGQVTELEIDDAAWRGILVLWLLGAGVLVAAGLLRYLVLRRMTPPEAALYLQDVLWRETRREQSRLNRWLAWAWLRRRRQDKEPS